MLLKINILISILFVLFCVNVFAEEPPSDFLSIDHLKGKHPSYESIKKGLEHPVTISFENTHIRDIIQYISKYTGMGSILDEGIFNENNEFEGGLAYISINMVNAPYREVVWVICQ